MNISEKIMQKVRIENQVYEEIEGKSCELCDIDWLSLTCRKLPCVAKNRPDGRDVCSKLQADVADSSSQLF